MAIRIILFCAVFAVGGCAETVLQRTQLGAQSDAPMSLEDYSALASGDVRVVHATELALRLADAYADAGRTTQQLQDIATGSLILATGWVALGAAEEVADEVLTERLIGAIAAERFLSRGVPATAIDAMYLGAQRMNCVATVPNLYLRRLDEAANGQNGLVEPSAAGFLMIAAMREIEYRTFASMASRNLEGVSTLTNAFGGAAGALSNLRPGGGNGGSGEGAPQRNVFGNGADGAPEILALEENPALVRFYETLTGCLASTDPSPSTDGGDDSA